MPASEIDEIFASKPRPKSIVSDGKQASTPSSSKSKKKGKKKGKKEDKASAEHDAQLVSSSKSDDGRQRKRKAPDVVLDPSIKVVSSKRKKVSAGLEPQRDPRSLVKSQKDQVHFADSRGTSSRKRTEEGWNVYKEDELGISHGGGGAFAAQCRYTDSSASPKTLPCVLLTVNVVFSNGIVLASSLHGLRIDHPSTSTFKHFGSFEAMRTPFCGPCGQ